MVEEIDFLAHITSSYPQEALSAYNHGMKNKWSFIMRTIRGISALFQPLETAIHRHLIPAITGLSWQANEEVPKSLIVQKGTQITALTMAAILPVNCVRGPKFLGN